LNLLRNGAAGCFYSELSASQISVATEIPAADSRANQRTARLRAILSLFFRCVVRAARHDFAEAIFEVLMCLTIT
jgi:hypothetical protein